MQDVALSDGQMMLVDDIDYLDVVYEGPWHPDKNNYAYRDLPGTKYVHEREYIHRFIGKRMGITGLVDHKNNDPLDNTRDNLRSATKSQNAMNSKRPSNNSSGVKGVWWDESRQKWNAEIWVNKKHIRLGRFETLEEAKAARQVAVNRYHGEFGRE